MLCPLRLKKEAEAAVLSGMPWVYTGEFIESSELLMTPVGSLVSIESAKGKRLATGYYNAKSQIAARVLTLENEAIDEAFFLKRLQRSLERRQKSIDIQYCRLVHSEADGLPGLLIDRFGDICVVQVGTAGMENLQSLWLPALEKLLAPRAVILRNDVAARKLEGLKQGVSIISLPLLGGHLRSSSYGEPKTSRAAAQAEAGGQGGGYKGNPHPDPLSERERELVVEVHENGCVYIADLLYGQKTGWFYDQRDNRRMIADLAKGKTLLDVYSHSGGFGVLAAKAGAEATLVDSSKLALELAKKAAVRNHVSCSYLQGDAFETMQKLAEEGKSYDIVLADPPAFVKSKKDFVSGMKGYEKVARLASTLVKDGGLLFIASCSHHASRGAFERAVLQGVKKSGRVAEILRQTGAAPDHPAHPKLPQSEYLKGILLQLSS